jgi:hypothetical protein
MPIILVTQEAEIRGIMVEATLANSSWDPSSKNPSQKRAGGVAQCIDPEVKAVEPLFYRCKALSSNSNPTKKKQNKTRNQYKFIIEILDNRDKLKTKNITLSRDNYHMHICMSRHFIVFFFFWQTGLNSGSPCSVYWAVPPALGHFSFETFSKLEDQEFAIKAIKCLNT